MVKLDKYNETIDKQWIFYQYSKGNCLDTLASNG